MIKENLLLIALALSFLVLLLMILMRMFSNKKKYSSSIKLNCLMMPLIACIIALHIIIGKTFDFVLVTMWMICLGVVIANTYYDYMLMKLQNYLNQVKLDNKNLLEIYDTIKSSNNEEDIEKARKFFQENYVEYNPNTEELKATPKSNNKQ